MAVSPAGSRSRYLTKGYASPGELGFLSAVGCPTTPFVSYTLAESKHTKAPCAAARVPVPYPGRSFFCRESHRQNRARSSRPSARRSPRGHARSFPPVRCRRKPTATTAGESPGPPGKGRRGSDDPGTTCVRQDPMAVEWLGQSTPRIARVRHAGPSQPTSSASWTSGDAPERVHGA